MKRRVWREPIEVHPEEESTQRQRATSARGWGIAPGIRFAGTEQR